MASADKSKEELIEERKQNLPLPEDPPVPSDWNSADATKVNVGSGRTQSDISYGAGSESGLRGPDTGATTGGVDTKVGREGHDNLSGIPKDATK